MLRLVDECDQCKKTIKGEDMLIIGVTSGEHLKSWWKVCPNCYEELYKKYVLPNLKVSKRQEKTLQQSENDIKYQLEKASKVWKQF